MLIYTGIELYKQTNICSYKKLQKDLEKFFNLFFYNNDKT